MILAVHAKLCRGAAGGYGNGPVSPRRHQRRRFHNGMGRGGAESPAVRACGVVQSRYLGGALCKVTAAPLVHISAGLLGAVYNVLHLVLVYPRICHHRQQSQHTGCLIRNVFQHNVSGQAGVYIVGPDNAARQLAIMIQTLRTLLLHKAGHLGWVRARIDTLKYGVVHDWIFRQRILVFRNKLRIHPHKVKHIACVHQQQEFLLRHYLSKPAIALIYGAGLVIPWLRNLRQFLRGNTADVYLIGIVFQHILKAPYMLGQLFQILTIRIYYALYCLGGTVVQHHVRRVHQYISCALYNALHCFSSF